MRYRAVFPRLDCGSKQFYTCASNGFHGCCSVDACDYDTCPDDDDSSATATVPFSTFHIATTTVPVITKVTTITSPLTTTLQKTTTTPIASTSTSSTTPIASTSTPSTSTGSSSTASSSSPPSSSPPLSSFSSTSSSSSPSPTSSLPPTAPTSHSGGLPPKAIAGIVTALVVLPLILLLAWWYRRSRAKKQSSKAPKAPPSLPPPPAPPMPPPRPSPPLHRLSGLGLGLGLGLVPRFSSFRGRGRGRHSLVSGKDAGLDDHHHYGSPSPKDANSSPPLFSSPKESDQLGKIPSSSPLAGRDGDSATVSSFGLFGAAPSKQGAIEQQLARWGFRGARLAAMRRSRLPNSNNGSAGSIHSHRGVPELEAGYTALNGSGGQNGPGGVRVTNPDPDLTSPMAAFGTLSPGGTSTNIVIGYMPEADALKSTPPSVGGFPFTPRPTPESQFSAFTPSSFQFSPAVGSSSSRSSVSSTFPSVTASPAIPGPSASYAELPADRSAMAPIPELPTEAPPTTLQPTKYVKPATRTSPLATPQATLNGPQSGYVNSWAVYRP